MSFAAGNWSNRLLVEDFNGDGRADLAVTNYAAQGYADDRSVTVLLAIKNGVRGSSPRRSP